MNQSTVPARAVLRPSSAICVEAWAIFRSTAQTTCAQVVEAEVRPLVKSATIAVVPAAGGLGGHSAAGGGFRGGFGRGGGAANGTVKCFRCQGPNHYARDCMAAPGTTALDSKPKTCYKCHKEGHIARECPEGAEYAT
ncbi:cellular nucleic acid-binding protein [Rhizoctonia solani AG-1 IB]|uniref:CCHC-type domain-containing protein n=2 Tax=Rhizoctonia solani TaxID=456999 RepID=A0A8H2WQM2_9AGAM|nr:unnamed protein product [Rhizoctonia solani]CCO27604.1 cellular nucleic acid-binding protein [Rhizoctonia solani AG-1 IB]